MRNCHLVEIFHHYGLQKSNTEGQYRRKLHTKKISGGIKFFVQKIKTKYGFEMTSYFQWFFNLIRSYTIKWVEFGKFNLEKSRQIEKGFRRYRHLYTEFKNTIFNFKFTPNFITCESYFTCALFSSSSKALILCCWSSFIVIIWESLKISF
jgi:hypothetical protein